MVEVVLIILGHVDRPGTGLQTTQHIGGGQLDLVWLEKQQVGKAGIDDEPNLVAVLLDTKETVDHLGCGGKSDHAQLEKASNQGDVLAMTDPAKGGFELGAFSRIGFRPLVATHYTTAQQIGRV